MHYSYEKNQSILGDDTTQMGNIFNFYYNIYTTDFPSTYHKMVPAYCISSTHGLAEVCGLLSTSSYIGYVAWWQKMTNDSCNTKTKTLTYPQSGAGHHLTSGLTTSALRSMNSSYLRTSDGSILRNWRTSSGCSGSAQIGHGMSVLLSVISTVR